MIVILFKSIRKLKDPNAFYSWSKTILVNQCRAMLRKRAPVISLEDRQEQAYNESYSLSEVKQDIMSCLNRLSSRHQEVIKLRYFMDMDYETIARTTCVPVGTVKSRVFNALAQLKEMMGGKQL